MVKEGLLVEKGDRRARIYLRADDKIIQQMPYNDYKYKLLYGICYLKAFGNMFKR